MRFFALAVAVSCVAGPLAPTAAFAQNPAAPVQTVGQMLSLTDAIAIANRSNPSYQTSLNARRSAAAQARTANGAFLPSLSSSLSGDYREGGTQIVQGTAFGAANNTMSTSGGVNANYNLSLRQFSDRKAAKANQTATEAEIGTAEQSLRVAVINQYLAVLQAQANAVLQDTLLVATTAQLELAKAKLQVGTGIQLDVEQAQVNNGQQQVAVLRARNQVDIAKIALFQQMGVDPVLSTQLQELTNMDMPALSVAQITDMARRQNPVLEANRAREEQSGYQLTSARRAYYPSFSLSGGLSGYTNRFADTDLLIEQRRAAIPGQIASCISSQEVRAALNLTNSLAQCSAITFTPSAESALRDAQSKYPFGFARNPYAISASLSLPLFDRFNREATIQNATVSRRNAQNTVRQQELKIGADVSTAWLTLTTSQQTVAIQVQNARTAQLALTLANQRYQVGSISLVELVQARSAFDRAETDRINAVYDFQRAFAQLEAAVGRPLR